MDNTTTTILSFIKTFNKAVYHSYATLGAPTSKLILRHYIYTNYIIQYHCTSLRTIYISKYLHLTLTLHYKKTQFYGKHNNHSVQNHKQIENKPTFQY